MGNRITYLFQNKEYILCGFDHLAAESPEEYSMSRGEEEWVSLRCIDLDSKPILPNIYPYDMLTFVWDDKHEYMYPTEIEHICFYDLYTTDIYHIDLNSLESYSKDNLHILLFKKFIRHKV